MFRSVFRKLLTIALALSLAIGQGAVVPAMAATMIDNSQSEMSSMKADAADPASCCPMCDKDQHADHGMKIGDCAAHCAAMAQAALPSYYPVFARQAAHMTYDVLNTTAISRSLPPDYPPPKA